MTIGNHNGYSGGTGFGWVDAKSTPALDRSQIEIELKSVRDEITRLSRLPRNVIEIGAAGPNATSVKGTDPSDCQSDSQRLVSVCVIPVLATNELKKLTVKLESLLVRSGADHNETKVLIKKLSDEVEGSNSDVKRSNAEVASNLLSIMSTFKSQSRDVEVVRVLTAVDHSVCETRELKLTTEWTLERNRLESALKAATERERSVSAELESRSRVSEQQLKNSRDELTAQRNSAWLMCGVGVLAGAAFASAVWWFGKSSLASTQSSSPK